MKLEKNARLIKLLRMKPTTSIAIITGSIKPNTEPCENAINGKKKNRKKNRKPSPLPRRHRLPRLLYQNIYYPPFGANQLLYIFYTSKQVFALLDFRQSSYCYLLFAI